MGRGRAYRHLPLQASSKMNEITIEAPAKINLTLDILRKLPSGYHELESVKQSVQIKDILTIRESENMGINCNIPEVPLDSS